jgi:hypothetical protein
MGHWDPRRQGYQRGKISGHLVFERIIRLPIVSSDLHSLIASARRKLEDPARSTNQGAGLIALSSIARQQSPGITEALELFFTAPGDLE